MHSWEGSAVHMQAICWLHVHAALLHMWDLQGRVLVSGCSVQPGQARQEEQKQCPATGRVRCGPLSGPLRGNCKPRAVLLMVVEACQADLGWLHCQLLWG